MGKISQAPRPVDALTYLVENPIKPRIKLRRYTEDIYDKSQPIFENVD